MLELIEQFDKELFLYLNQFHNPFWDKIMWHISGKLEWIPLYIILLILVIKNYKKESWRVILGAAIVVVLADQISVKLFKDVFQRFRPCHNLEIESMVHIVNQKCGGKFSFVSSHAANSFAIASFIGLVLQKWSKKALIILLIWAAVVSYSRIYLGVHYPLDIISGAILGVLIAYFIFFIIKRIR